MMRKAMEKRLADLLYTFDRCAAAGDRENCGKALYEMMTLRVLDPAAGRGIFLLEGMAILRKFYCSLSRRISADKGLTEAFRGELEKLRRPALYALKTNLYGVDLSAAALEVAMFTLLEAAQDEIEPGDVHVILGSFKHENSLASGVRPEDRAPDGKILGDSDLSTIINDRARLREELRFLKESAFEISSSQPPLVFNWESAFPEAFYREDGTLKENPGFDFVVGNPPWGAAVDEMGAYFEDSYPECCWGYKDTLELFLGRSMILARRGGIIAQVLPNSFQFLPCYRDAREMLMEKRIYFLANLGDGIFPGVSTPCSALVFENSPWKRNWLQVMDLTGTGGREKKTRMERGAGARWLDQASYSQSVSR
jgi:hypothetical protein